MTKVKEQRYIKLEIKLGMWFSAFAIIFMVVPMFVLTLNSRKNVHEDIRQRLHDIVRIGSLHVDADTHSTLTNPSDENNAPYLRIKQKLKEIRDNASDIFYVYTMRLDADGLIRFVVDAEENPEEIAHLGDVYDDASEMLKANFTTLDQAIVEKKFYTDKWGTWLSGYAPFYLADGQREGVLGMDIKADKVLAYEKKLLWTAIAICMSIIPLAAILGWLLGRRIAAPIVSLTDNAKAIAGGDLNRSITVESKDEIGMMAQVFNLMTETLRGLVGDLERRVEERTTELTQKIREYKQVEEALNSLTAFERIVTNISSKFVRLAPDEIDKGVKKALRTIGEFADVDRAYVFWFQNDGRKMDNTHEWCAEGVDPQIQSLKGIRVEDELPWFFKRIKAQETFYVPSVSDLPSEANLEKTHFQMQNIQSLIVVPMVSGNVLKGFFGFDSVRSIKHWPEEIIILLKITGEVISNALERKRIENAMRQSEEKFRQLADLLPQVVFETDEKGYLTFANRIAFDLFGYTEDDFKEGLTALDMIIPEDRDRAYEKVKSILGGETSTGTEYTALKKDHSRFPALIYANPIISDGNTVGLRGIIADLSEFKQTQEALRESEEKLVRSKKMEALGLLAGGVAHDLNNVLSGIVSYPELILMDLPSGSKLRKPVETMLNSGNRAVTIVQDLLTVARGVATTREPLNINDLATDYLNSPEFEKLKQFHPDVAVKTDLDPNLLNTNGSPVHITKVLMNLVSNASEAIDGSGNVLVSTINRYVDRPIHGYDEVKTGEYAVLSVSDDGPGISSDDLERIFDPFYTKKVMGRSGTGLGLSVVWNVVQDHEGYINVTTDENSTTFELYFPITRDNVPDKASAVPIQDFKGDSETILVIDDVESQREISSHMLATLGYKTLAVSSGEEAIEFLKEHSVDLILLDMIMDPGINGRETYEGIIKIHPNQKAIIVSGFAETDEVKETQRLGAGPYIKKPLTLETIGLAVKKELNK